MPTATTGRCLVVAVAQQRKRNAAAAVELLHTPNDLVSRKAVFGRKRRKNNGKEVEHVTCSCAYNRYTAEKVPSNWFPLMRVKWLPLMANSFAVSGMVCLKCDLLPNDWFVDSGCTKHMTGNRKLFTLYKAHDGGHVIFRSNLKGKVIGEDETVNLVKSSKLGKLHDTAKNRMKSEHDDDDRTLAKTLLNIKRSAAKGKAIMQESEPPKKIKKKEMIQISLDEEFAKSFYEEEQAQILQDEVYAKQVEAQWIADKERIPQEEKRINEREKVINWNDPDVLRYHAVPNRPFSKAEVRKNMCTYLKNQGGYKMSHFKGMSYVDIRPIFKRVWDQNQAFVPKDSKIEKEVIKRPGFDLQQESSKKTRGSKKKTLARKRAREKQKEFAMEIESLDTKYPIVDWKTHILTRKLYGVMDLHRLVEERYATSIPKGYDLMLWGDLKILYQPNEEDDVWRHQHEYNLISWRLFDSCGIRILLMDNGIDSHDDREEVSTYSRNAIKDVKQKTRG
ncbi:hypothetical protein Tco_1154566 [Tanacetum coccineum]